MNLVFDAPQWLALILAVLLIIAAAEDAVRLRISNIAVGLIAVGAVAAALIEGLETDVWENLLIFAVLLAIGTPLFAAGKLGGGDVKLLAVSALWFDLMSALMMLVYVFIAGGVLAVFVLVLRTFGWSDQARAKVNILKPGGGIPYGVAIAIGVLIAMWIER